MTRRGAIHGSILVIFFFAMALPLGAPRAQETDDRMGELLRELDSLIDRGAEQGLADPWFLDDLRALSARYGETWPVVLLDHRFDSQGSSPKAPWQIRQGNMKMDWSRGLRSQVERGGGAQDRSDEEVVGEIIGGLLGQALGTNQNQQASPDPSEPALALADMRVTNAFQLEAVVSARPLQRSAGGGMELGVYQGSNAGYRVMLEPGEGSGGVISLVAVSSRGSVRDLASATFERDVLNDEPFTLLWSRRPDGAMSVQLADQPLLSVADRSFQDPFDGLLIGNRGGDFAGRQITVRGTQ